MLSAATEAWLNKYQKPMSSTCELYDMKHPSTQSCSYDDESSGSKEYEPPRKRMSEEEILDGIREYSKASREAFRQSLQAEEDCVAGVTGIKRAGVALRDVPEHLKTPRVCLAAVTNYGGALEYVPENFKTSELCQAAVSSFGGALEYVPEHFVTPELCLTAVAQDTYAITSVPENFKTPEFYMAAVSKNGEALEHVPENLKTLEICRAAVMQDGSALQYVPIKMKKMLVYLKSPPPTKGKSYAFLILTGFIGGHRFYLKKFKTGILFFFIVCRRDIRVSHNLYPLGCLVDN
jgi:hypothetical protein